MLTDSICAIEIVCSWPIVPESTENVGKFMDALDPYLVGRATLAHHLGIDAMYLSCVCWSQSSTEVDPLVETRMAEIGARMKAVYQDKLIGEPCGLPAGAGGTRPGVSSSIRSGTAAVRPTSPTTWCMLARCN